LPFDLLVGDGVAAVDVINALLNRCDKLHAFSNLINSSIIGELLNRL
jgi:hypothetical protein